MKTTQLFTGHNVVLSEIQAVGPIMTENKSVSFMVTLTLYLEITLRGGAVLRHEHKKLSVMGDWTEQDKKNWNGACEDLERQRTRLIGQWEEVATQTA